MSHIHFDIFFDYFIECALRHFVDRLKSCRKIHYRRETEITLGNIDRTHTTGEIVHILEKMTMNGAKPRERAHFERIEQPHLEQLPRTQFRQALFFARQLNFVRNSQLVPKHRRIPP